MCVVLVGLALMFLWPGPSAAPRPAPTPQQIAAREEALSRATVFTTPIDLAADPNTGVIDVHLTACTFIPSQPTGTTPKFDCRLESGEKIKVKYGWTREIPVEIAATRLLGALGFGADRMSKVDIVRCYGCVVDPFHVRSFARILHLGGAFDSHLNFNHAIDFVNVSVERRLVGAAIEAGAEKGWAFYELSKIDPARGGATRAEVDALRLMAMLLNHWDNKPENQRLLCEGQKHTGCDHPLAMIQDAGSDFGPYKMNLKKWRQTPIWSDVPTCTLSMKTLPFEGATFSDVRISEDGRRLLGDRLTKLAPAQVKALFTMAGFDDANEWADAFQEKIREITDRPPCE